MKKETIELLKRMKEVIADALALHTTEGNQIADKLVGLIVDYIDENTETYEESCNVWDELIPVEAEA